MGPAEIPASDYPVSCQMAFHHLAGATCVIFFFLFCSSFRLLAFDCFCIEYVSVIIASDKLSLDFYFWVAWLPLHVSVASTLIPTRMHLSDGWFGSGSFMQGPESQ